MEFKPFTQQEMKMLVFNKVRNGLGYDKAVSQLNGEIEVMKDIHFKKSLLEEDKDKDCDIAHFFVEDDVIARNDMEEKKQWCSCGHLKSDHFCEACSKCSCKMFEEEDFVAYSRRTNVIGYY